jgi:hypothetical protein
MGKHRWKGELAKRIRPKVIRPRGLRVSAETARAANKQMEDLYHQAIEKEYFTKLDLLMDDYGIADKADFFNLALALAIEHVPGFRLDPPPLELKEIGEGIQLVLQGGNERGRPLEWTPDRLHSLLSAVEEAKKKHGISSDRKALEIIAQNDEWRRPARHRGGPAQWRKTLENRLHDARRSKEALSFPRKLKPVC